MKVLVSTADKGGCAHYRLIFSSQVLQAQGLDVTIDFQASQIYAEKDHKGNILKVRSLDYDLVIFQRPMTNTAAQVIKLIRQQGIAVVVELDDDYWAIQNRNVYWDVSQPGHNPTSNHQFLKKSCEAADLVTVSTPALAKKIPNKNVIVLRNCIPERYLSIEKPPISDVTEGKTIVGWSGTPDTHAGDLDVVGDSIARSCRKHDAKFLCIGAEHSGEIMGFKDGEALYSPWVTFENYPQAVKAFDIGLVPLKINDFNQSKSYLKGLEYASLGIPFVASPTEEYLRLNRKHQVGHIAAQKHDWGRMLDTMLQNPRIRQLKADTAKAAVSTLTYEKHAHLWAEAWEKALELRRA